MKIWLMRGHQASRSGGALVFLALLVAVLAACGGEPRSAERDATPTEEPTDTPEATETEEPSPTRTPRAATATPTQAADSGETGAYPVLSTDALEFGVVSHLYYTDHERVLQLAREAGFGWVRQQVHWKDTEIVNPGAPSDYTWEQLDIIVDAVNAYDMKLLISIVRSPEEYTADGSDGLPAEPEYLGNFVEAMATRYGDRIHAYEIWNEQNLAHETGGTISIEDAGRYVELLIEAYQRIKAINPDAYVVIGALSPTNYYDPSVGISDLEYYRAMYTYRDGIINDYFDAQGVHPAGSANPPETLWPDNPSTAEGWTEDSTFYFRHIEHVREMMEEHGMGDHQVWITEFGWATENVTPGYEYGNQISYEEQADYISRAMQMTYEEYSWVGNMFLWNMNFAVTWGQTDPPQPLHEQAAFSILNPDWSPRPSFEAVQETIDEIQVEQATNE